MFFYKHFEKRGKKSNIIEWKNEDEWKNKNQAQSNKK